jgi:hypothetical protein
MADDHAVGGPRRRDGRWSREHGAKDGDTERGTIHA